ncbi:4735_t:CDS:2, partial [Acaulospora morrowiae]
ARHSYYQLKAANKEKRTINTKQLEFMSQSNLKYGRENENENLKDEIDQEINGRMTSSLFKQRDEEEHSLRKRRDEMNIKEAATPPVKKTKTTKNKVITEQEQSESEIGVAVETKIKQKKIDQLFDEMRKHGIYILVQPFKSLSQSDAEDLFEKINQNTVVKIDLPDFIEKYLQDLLNGDIESAFLKVRNPPSKDAQPLLLWTSEICRHFIFYYYYGGLQRKGDEKTWSSQTIYRILDLFLMFFGGLISEVSYGEITSSDRNKNDAVIYQDQNATIIYEQSFGPTDFDEAYYLEDITKLARNGVDDLNIHFIQYRNSSITTAKNFKSISIHGYKYFISIYLTDLVRAKTYRIYEIFKCKIPTSYTERWLLKKIANLGIYLEKLLTEHQSIKAKMCEEDAMMENSHGCVSDWITIPDNT